MENDANKNELRRIIKSKLVIGLTLKDIIRTIEEEVGIKISSPIDKEFIESEFVTYCKELLLEEIKAFVKKLNQNDAEKLIVSIRSVSTIGEFQLIFQQKLFYYNLLMKHIDLVKKDDSNSLTILMKNTCVNEIDEIMDKAKDELQFLERFLDFMSYTYVLPCFLRETQLLAFCRGTLEFSQLVSNILSIKFSETSPRFEALCDSARQLNGKNNLFFMDLIKFELEFYTIPIKIEVIEEQGSKILRIWGMNIVLSDIKAEIESKLESNPKIDGVSFVVDRIFHIDDSLTNELVWHGKNISCVAKTIDVRKSGLEWDVSGLHNGHIHPADCGRETTGDGKNGADGFAGESGGNISILAEEIINASWLTISSNGGNGSHGQDGGNGRNGDDGASIDFEKFKEQFPTTAYTKSEIAHENLRKTVDAIKSDRKITHIWKEDGKNLYLEVTTNSGNKITFSHTEGWLTTRQSILLYKGACGSSGRSGGQGGFGGQGGYAGELSIEIQSNDNTCDRNLCIQRAKQGENGDDGKDGLYGTFGKNGWDVAWMDYVAKGWPKYYGNDENSTLQIEFYSENSIGLVYCSCKNSEWKYAKITTPRLEHPNLKISNRLRRELQQHAMAVRQKANLGQSMNEELTRILQRDSKSKIFNLQSKMQSLQDATLQNNTSTEEQELKQIFDVNVVRNIQFEGTKSSNQKALLNTKATSKTTNYYNSLQNLGKLENESNSEDHVYGSIDELIKQNCTGRLAQLETSRLSLLRNIAKELDVYYSPTSTIEIDLSARNADIPETIIHRTLGTLRQYLCCDEQTQRTNITNYLKEIQKNRKAKKIVMSPLREYVLEAGGAEVADAELKKFYNLYEFHLKRQKEGLIAFPDAIDEYCANNDSVYDSFIKYLAEHGCKSNIYLNLLAHIFKVNRRICYEVETTNDFELLLDLNRNANLVLYFSSKFDRLTLNDHLRDLIAERRGRSLQYKKIIMDVEMFHTNSQLRNYFSSENFSNKNDYSEDEIEDFYRKYDLCEATAVKNIAENFPKNFEIETRLEELTKSFSGQRGILYFMEKHFAHEAIRVSVPELDYIINYVLNYSAASDDETELFLTWIFAAYDQENWIDEVILLELEDFYGKKLLDKLAWRDFLSGIGNKMILISFGQQLAQCNRSTLTMECVQEIFYLLSKIPNQEVSVGETKLTHWPYHLRSVFWTYTLSKIVHWANDDDLDKLYYHVQIIENNLGRDFTYQLLDALKEKVESHEDFIFLSENYMFNNVLRKISSQTWMVNDNHLEQLKSIRVKEWFEQMNIAFAAGSQQRSLKELTNIIQRDSNTSESIKSIVPKVEAAIQRNSNSLERIIPIVALVEMVTSSPDYKNALILAFIDDVINETRKYRLRDTQKLAVLLLLNNERSTLAQVSTGEGKSLIVVSAAVIKVCNGEKVHIVTSSSVLARRDAEINSDIYEHFKIQVSHNCSEDIEERKAAYSSSEVVYGELSNFQRDYLLDNFYGQNILGKRNFGKVNVIVDEVDSLLLDKGNNMLYLARDLPGLDKLESVYVFIWSWMCKPEKPTDRFDLEAIRQAVLRDLYGLITVNDISHIDPKLSMLQTLKLWNCLIDGNIVDQTGKLQVDHITEDTVQEVLSSEFVVYVGRLFYLIADCLKRPRRIHMPNYLRDFVERHLDAWIRSALCALFMSEGVDYVVDVGRSRSPQIIILDKGTGTDQTSSQWDEGLHQFLQLKHNCKITLQSLKAVFTSNVSFFKLYKNLYGLTGTLGSQMERDILTQIHNVDFFTVPTAKVKQLEELQPVLCSDSKEWAQLIHNEIEKLTQVGRSVLVIAETVKDAEELYNMIGCNARLYTREFDEFAIVKGTEHFTTGQVIIATNLAGRGTDIKISEELRCAGGLHVILAYLPGNVRIEEQAFGRTARCGDKGSAQLIIIDSAPSGGSKQPHNIFRLKKERDQKEVRRLSEIESCYKNQIMLEEYCFEEFKKTYDNLKKSIADNSLGKDFKRTTKHYVDTCTSVFTGNEIEKLVDPDFTSILLDAVLETWTFWLDLNGNLIQDCANKNSHKQVVENLKQLNSNLEKLKDSSIDEWVTNSPVQMVKLGWYMANKHNSKAKAIELFDRVIKMEPAFSDSAHYYKAFVLIKDRKVDEFKKELRETIRILNQHSASAQMAGALVGALKMENKQSILQIDAYEEQQAAFAHIYQLILNSIQNIFGHPVSVQSLIYNNIPIDKAFEIFDKLIEDGILTKPKVELFQEDTVEKIAVKYGADNLKNFVSKINGTNFENEQSFKQLLKKEIVLPSREYFFRNLVQQEVLCNGAKLVSFDIESLETLHSELGQKVKSLHSLNQLRQFKVDSTDIYLSATTPNSEHILVDRKSLKECLGSKWYTILKHLNVLSFHYKAEINEDKLNSVQFSHFDSISLNDFKKVNIIESEATIIVNALLKRGILKQRHDDCVYNLNMTFEKISGLQLLPDYPVYEDATYNLLRICFLYRQEYERLKLQFEAKSCHIQIGLLSKPHNNLIRDLILGGVLIPTKVIDKGLDKIEKSLKKLFPKQNDQYTTIFNLLRSSKATLETLETPDGNLKPLRSVYSTENLGMAEEFYRFSYNGYDQLVELVEKKWSRAMVKRSLLVMAIGVAQVVLAAVFELVPVVGQFGSIFLLQESVSDLCYVGSSAFSGHLSWEDYRSHKSWSIPISPVTAYGVGAVHTDISTSSVNDQKLAGRRQEADKKLVNAAGNKAVAKAVAANIVKSANTFIANDAWIQAVSFAIDNCLKNFFNMIYTKVSTAICSKIDDNEACKVFEEVHKIMGTKKGKEFVKDTTDDYTKYKKTDREFNSKTLNVTETILQHLQTAAMQIDHKTIASIMNIVKTSIYAIEIGSVVALIVGFATSYIKYLKSKLDEQSRPNKMASENTRQCENFKKEVSAEAKQMLINEMESIFFEKIKLPLVIKGLSAFKDAIEQACDMYQKHWKENEFTKSQDNKHNYEIEREKEMIKSERDKLNKRYQKELQRLKYNSRNPDLKDSITEENMPMGMICAEAAANVIGDIKKCSQVPMEIRVKRSETHFTPETSDVQPSSYQRNQ